MTTYLLAMTLALLGTAACRERPSTETDNLGVGKPTEQLQTQTVSAEHDDDFIQTRSSFEKSMQERMTRLDTHIDQLESRTDAAGHDAAVRLRSMRDRLGDRLSEARTQSEAGWDRFESEMSRSVDELERDVEQLLGY